MAATSELTAFHPVHTKSIDLYEKVFDVNVKARTHVYRSESQELMNLAVRLPKRESDLPFHA